MILKLLPVLPKARAWLRRTLAEHDAAARPVSSFGFPRLGDYYPRPWLERGRAVVVDRVPTPPVDQWGLGSVFDFGATSGITFGDVFFIAREAADDESIFFHEMVHVVQYRTLGVGRFLALYGLLRMSHAYLNHPLERPAFELQRRFDEGVAPFDPTPIAARQASEVMAGFARQNLGNRFLLMAARGAM